MKEKIYIFDTTFLTGRFKAKAYGWFVCCPYQHQPQFLDHELQHCINIVTTLNQWLQLFTPRVGVVLSYLRVLLIDSIQRSSRYIFMLLIYPPIECYMTFKLFVKGHEKLYPCTHSSFAMHLSNMDPGVLYFNMPFIRNDNNQNNVSMTEIYV